MFRADDRPDHHQRRQRRRASRALAGKDGDDPAVARRAARGADRRRPTLEACSRRARRLPRPPLPHRPGEIAAEFADARRDRCARHARLRHASSSGSSTTSTTSSSCIQILAFFADERPHRRRRARPGRRFPRRAAARHDPALRRAGAAGRPRPTSTSPPSVWADLATPTPEAIAAGVDALDARLPFLAAALHRFLEELPAPGNGLGRTEAGDPRRDRRRHDARRCDLFPRRSRRRRPPSWATGASSTSSTISPRATCR